MKKVKEEVAKTNFEEFTGKPDEECKVRRTYKSKNSKVHVTKERGEEDGIARFEVHSKIGEIFVKRFAITYDGGEYSSYHIFYKYPNEDRVRSATANLVNSDKLYCIFKTLGATGGNMRTVHPKCEETLELIARKAKARLDSIDFPAIRF